jgi:hypothetical protein
VFSVPLAPQSAASRAACLTELARVNNSTFTKDTPPTLPYRVGQAAKRQAKQLNAVLWRGGSFNREFANYVGAIGATLT